MTVIDEQHDTGGQPASQPVASARLLTIKMPCEINVDKCTRVRMIPLPSHNKT
jgi:hypothetical protein